MVTYISQQMNRSRALASILLSARLRLLNVIFFVVLLSSCASQPTEVFRGYTDKGLAESSLASVDMGDATWATFNELHVDGNKYGSVKLPPGAYHIKYSKTFAVSFLVDPRMWVSQEVSTGVVLDPGRTYRLRATRTYGPGYRMYFWIEDDLGNVVAGTQKM
jgi:hypothetical protein